MRGDLAPHVRRVQLRVRVRTVPVSRAARTEHHRASLHRALVHLSQVHRREVYLQRSFVAESLEADVALHSLLARGWVDELDAEAERPGRRRVLAAVGILGRAALVAPVLVPPAEAGTEFSEVELGRGLADTGHHEIVQTGRQAGNRTELFAFHHVTVITRCEAGGARRGRFATEDVRHR